VGTKTKCKLLTKYVIKQNTIDGMACRVAVSERFVSNSEQQGANPIVH